ncbi:UNVERIFIED_CONTAM: hypothetical protein O1L42_32245 [Pseudomonas aeruginosa]
MMNAHTNKGFASRVGFGLGTLVRFCLHDRRPVVRWVKRACLAVVLFVIFAQNFTWLASTFMTLLSFGLIGVVLVKGDFSIFRQLDEDEGKRLANSPCVSVSQAARVAVSHAERLPCITS